MVTVWTPKATVDLRKAFDYISQSSPKNAKKVIDEIIALTDKLPRNPEIYSLDKYKKNNNGSWRAFEKISLQNFIPHYGKRHTGCKNETYIQNTS